MRKELNILFVTESFYPYRGGVEKHVLGLSRKLIEDGHRVSVLTYKKSKEDKAVDLHEGINIYRLKTKSNKYLNYAGLIQQVFLNKTLNDNFDVVHFHDYAVFNLLYRILLLKCGIKHNRVYVTFHGWEGIYPVPEHIIAKRKYCEEKSEGNICIGHFIEKWYGTKADIITYGAVEEKMVSGKTEKQILYAGRLETDTGFDILLKAFEEITSIDNDYRLAVCGDGSMAHLLKNRKNVEFKGWLDNTSEDVARSEIVFASGYLSMLEALIMKKKVICYYDNELKKDYFEMIPEYEKMIWVAGNKEEIIKAIKEATSGNYKSECGYQFAKKHAWEKLKEDYYRLWKL